MSTATVNYTRNTELVNDMGYRHTVLVQEMTTGFNYEVWLDSTLIADQISPYTGEQIANGIEEFFFDQGFYTEEIDHN